jgi:hypothetical protein
VPIFEGKKRAPYRDQNFMEGELAKEPSPSKMAIIGDSIDQVLLNEDKRA